MCKLFRSPPHLMISHPTIRVEKAKRGGRVTLGITSGRQFRCVRDMQLGGLAPSVTGALVSLGGAIVRRGRGHISLSTSPVVRGHGSTVHDRWGFSMAACAVLDGGWLPDRVDGGMSLPFPLSVCDACVLPPLACRRQSHSSRVSLWFFYFILFISLFFQYY